MTDSTRLLAQIETAIQEGESQGLSTGAILGEVKRLLAEDRARGDAAVADLAATVAEIERERGGAA